MQSVSAISRSAGRKSRRLSFLRLSRSIKTSRAPSCLFCRKPKKNVYGYLPIEVQQMVADGLGVPLSEVFGVATFYSQFSLTPKGKYNISVCLGTACYVKGSGKILEELSKELGIEAEECTEDGKFSLTACRCIGAADWLRLSPLTTMFTAAWFPRTQGHFGKVRIKPCGSCR